MLRIEIFMGFGILEAIHSTLHRLLIRSTQATQYTTQATEIEISHSQYHTITN